MDAVFDSIAVTRYESGHLAAPGGAKHALLQSTSLIGTEGFVHMTSGASRSPARV